MYVSEDFLTAFTVPGFNNRCVLSNISLKFSKVFSNMSEDFPKISEDFFLGHFPKILRTFEHFSKIS